MNTVPTAGTEPLLPSNVGLTGGVVTTGVGAVVVVVVGVVDVVVVVAVVVGVVVAVLVAVLVEPVVVAGADEPPPPAHAAKASGASMAEAANNLFISPPHNLRANVSRSRSRRVPVQLLAVR